MSTSDRPISKRVNEDLITLTSTDGPLYKLVEEIRKSNRLARVNQQRLTVALAGLLLCVVGISVSIWMMFASVTELKAMHGRQIEALEYADRLVKFAEETDKKVDAAQSAINSAPRVVADQKTGQLVVLAPVQEEEGDDEIEVEELDPKTKRMIKRKRRINKRSPSGAVQGMKTVELPKPGAPDQQQKHLQIPIHMDEAQVK